MMSESCAAPPWHVSSLSFQSYSQRSPCPLWVFISRLKMFTFLASLVAAGSLFQLFTTLWLKNVLWPLFSLSLLLSGSCHSFRVLCCHLKPHILVHFVHLRNNFVRLYHVHCSCPLFSFPMSPVLSLCIFLHMCVLSNLISFLLPAVALSPRLVFPPLSMAPLPGPRTPRAVGRTARELRECFLVSVMKCLLYLA